MKKIFFSLFLLACLSPLHAQIVSKTAALSVAAHYFSAKTGKITTMQTAPTTMQRSGSPTYYVCSPANGKGFVIVAATKASMPILAYSADNNFPAENISPEVSDWLDGYQQQLTEINAQRYQPTQEMNEMWKALENDTYSAPENNFQIDLLLRTTWAQDALYSQNCPTSSTGQHALVGCVATAMAQIMNYWKFPVTGAYLLTDIDADMSNGISGTFTAWVGGAYYNWANMPNALNGTTPANQINEVARLSYDCGVAVNMNYGTAASSSHVVPNAGNVLKNIFGYANCTMMMRDTCTTANWTAKIRAELEAGRPVLYRGNSGMDGHAWVCDGYNGSAFHMNWGWGGAYDGFYTLADLHPDNQTYHFNTAQGAVIGIQPPGCQVFFEGPLPIIGAGTPIPLEISNAIHLTAGTVQPGKVAVIHAGYEVILKPGFSALTGSTAHIYIEGCDGIPLLPSENEDRSSSEKTPIETSDRTLQVAPNPFTGSTTITYTLSTAQEVDLSIFNAVGNLVARPFSQELQEAGQYEYQFNADNLPVGIYFLVFQTGGQKLTKRLVLTH